MSKVERIEAVARYNMSMVISFPGQILYGERYQSIFFLGGIEKNSPSTIAKREVKGTNQIVIKPSVLDIPFRNKFHWAFEYVRIVEHSPTGQRQLVSLLFIERNLETRRTMRCP
jgi:hypothetical protein